MKVENEEVEMKIKIPFATVLVVLSTILVLAILKVIAPLLMSLFLASLLAVSLYPLIQWMQQRGMPRWVAISILTLFLSSCLVTIGAMIVPQLMDQVSDFIQNLPKYKSEILAYLSPYNPIRPFVEKNLTSHGLIPKDGNMKEIIAAGNYLFRGFGEMFLIFVFAIYLLIDGPRVVEWLSSFFSQNHQVKIRNTTDEVSQVIFSYVAGQLITSILAFVFVFIALSLMHLPNVLLLAFLAGIFDILPVLGFFLAVIPAILFALTISPSSAVIVVGVYILYHAIENYLIIPAIYGNRLRVSSFVVLVSLIAAGMLAGVEGAIAVLPIVASYPIIERIWLKQVVGTQAVADHSKNA